MGGVCKGGGTVWNIAGVFFGMLHVQTMCFDLQGTTERVCSNHH